MSRKIAISEKSTTTADASRAPSKLADGPCDGCEVKEPDPVAALVRCLIAQAARDREFEIAHRSEDQIEAEIRAWMVAESETEVTYRVQIDYQTTLRTAAGRHVAEGRPNLGILMFATAIEHWINGMLAVGLERRGEQLRPEDEKGSIEDKVRRRWPELFGTPSPARLRQAVLRLTDARNEFVHHKWPSRSEAEQGVQDALAAELADTALPLLAALDDLEDKIVFGRQRETLDRVLDRMGIGERDRP